MEPSPHDYMLLCWLRDQLVKERGRCKDVSAAYAIGLERRITAIREDGITALSRFQSDLIDLP